MKRLAYAVGRFAGPLFLITVSASCGFVIGSYSPAPPLERAWRASVTDACHRRNPAHWPREAAERLTSGPSAAVERTLRPPKTADPARMGGAAMTERSGRRWVGDRPRARLSVRAMSDTASLRKAKDVGWRHAYLHNGNSSHDLGLMSLGGDGDCGRGNTRQANILGSYQLASSPQAGGASHE